MYLLPVRLMGYSRDTFYRYKELYEQGGEAIKILKERKKQNDKMNLKALQQKYVFPYIASASGHLSDPNKAWNRILKEAQIEDLRLHDIRRTLGSYQAITGTSLPIIGKSLGHKSSQATQVYSRMNLDPVRESIEKAVDMMSNFGSKKKK